MATTEFPSQPKAKPPVPPEFGAPGEFRHRSVKRSTFSLWLTQDGLFGLAAVTVTLGLALVYLLGRHSGGPWAWIGLPLDDAWIHLTYARSFAEHGLFHYNPGVAEAGLSSPLWVVLLGPVYLLLTPLGVPPALLAKGLSLLFALATPILVYRLVKALGFRNHWAWLAGLTAAVEPNLVYGSVGGMEGPLFAFLTLLALDLVWRRRYWATGVVLGLGVVARPEGAVTALIVGAIPLIEQYLKRDKVALVTGRELLRAVQLFLPSALLGGAWAIYNYSVNGSPFPNTFFVKHNFALGLWNWENLRAVVGGYLAHLALLRGPLALGTLGLAAAAVHGLVRRGRAFQVAAVLAVPLAQLYAFSINVKVAAEALPWTYFTRRYLDFTLPLLIVLAVSGAAVLWEWATAQRRRAVVLLAPVVALALTAGVAVNLAGGHRLFVDWYGWDTENIERVDVAMGRWVRDNLPAGARIATTEAGAIRFFARPDQEIIDLLGLNNHECTGRPSEDLLHEFEPDYLIVFRPGVSDWTLYRELVSFRPGRLTILGGAELVALEVVSPPPWPPQ